MTSTAPPLDARPAARQARGMLWVAVAGPSGAGKDSLLAGARRLLAGEARIHFARRSITRPADAGGEEHEHLDAAAFHSDDMVLQWRAHGWRYGIRREEVARAPVTVLSLSRTVLEEAARLAPQDSGIRATLIRHFLAEGDLPQARRQLTLAGSDVHGRTAGRLAPVWAAVEAGDAAAALVAVEQATTTPAAAKR